MTPTFTLNDGHQLPAIGLGTWPMREDAPAAVRTAIETGYRLIDTATRYENEAEVGRGIADAALPREELVVTTKVRGNDQGYESTLRAAEASCRALGLDHLDLYLIHWPLPRLEKYVETWRAMIKLRDEGVVRSIGVSNFMPAHLDRIVEETGVTPSVNQVELHPYFSQRDMRLVHAERGILTQSWSPLGRKSDLLTSSTLEDIAREHGVTAPQVALRWHVQLGALAIPKSSDPQRQRANLDVFGFELSEDEMARIGALERGRQSHDPDTHEEF